MSEEDNALRALFDRMTPNLKKRILRHSNSDPDAMNLDIVLLASVATIRERLEQ
jgi:hypothetical protein